MKSFRKLVRDFWSQYNIIAFRLAFSLSSLYGGGTAAHFFLSSSHEPPWLHTCSVPAQYAARAPRVDILPYVRRVHSRRRQKYAPKVPSRSSRHVSPGDFVVKSFCAQPVSSGDVTPCGYRSITVEMFRVRRHFTLPISYRTFSFRYGRNGRARQNLIFERKRIWTRRGFLFSR